MRRTLAVLLALLLGAAAWGATYYVDFDAGADTNNGTSTATPWKHCPGDGNAADNADITLAAGDIVVFKGGVTYTGGISTNASGSSGSVITYRSGDRHSPAWGTGAGYVENIGGGLTGFRIEHSYVTLDGMNVKSTSNCINIASDGDVSYVVLQYCDIESVESPGVFIQRGSYITVTQSNIHDCGNCGIYVSTTATGTAANHITLTYNTISDIVTNDGIVYHDDGGSMGAYHTITNNTISGCDENGLDILIGSYFTVTDNDISDCTLDAVTFSHSTDIVFERNYVHATTSYGLTLGRDSSPSCMRFTGRNNLFDTPAECWRITGPVDEIRLYNNTFKGQDGTWADLFTFTDHAWTDVVVANNIFYSPGGGRMGRWLGSGGNGPGDAELTMDYNLYMRGGDVVSFYWADDTSFSFAEFQALYGQEASGIGNDDPELTDFMPSATSPVLGVADVIAGFTTDYYEHTRGALWDIGAVERNWVTTYTVTYDGNGNTGGTVPTDGSSPYEESATVTVLGNTGSLVRAGYTFNDWNTAANGSGTAYDSTGTDTFSMPSSNVTLYAQWTVIPSAGGGNTAARTFLTLFGSVWQMHVMSAIVLAVIACYAIPPAALFASRNARRIYRHWRRRK